MRKEQSSADSMANREFRPEAGIAVGSQQGQECARRGRTYLRRLTFIVSNLFAPCVTHVTAFQQKSCSSEV
jgi:hypothetical protein